MKNRSCTPISHERPRRESSLLFPAAYFASGLPAEESVSLPERVFRVIHDTSDLLWPWD
jgi:hypothetical protein